MSNKSNKIELEWNLIPLWPRLEQISKQMSEKYTNPNEKIIADVSY